MAAAAWLTSVVGHGEDVKEGPCRWDGGEDFSALWRDLSWCPASHPLQAVPTMGCQGHGAEPARAAAWLAMSPSSSLPSLPWLDPALKWLGRQHGEALLGCSNHLSCTTGRNRIFGFSAPHCCQTLSLSPACGEALGAGELEPGWRVLGRR